jgi:hypothetical protein
MGLTPERPCNDISWVDTSLHETPCYPADFLDRPANEDGRFGDLAGFFGAGLFA